MAISKVNIEALAQLSIELQKSIDNFEMTKAEMDKMLNSFPWDDPVATLFKQNYFEELKPLNDHLIPSIKDYISYIEKQGTTIGDYIGAAFSALLGVGAIAATSNAGRIGKNTIDDYSNVRESLRREGRLCSSALFSKLAISSDAELEKEQKKWEDIEVCAHLSNESYKDSTGLLPRGYVPFSEASPDSLSPIDRELQAIVSEANINANPHNLHYDASLGYNVYGHSGEAPGFQCELYKSPEGQYILAFRGTDEMIADVKTDAVGALLKNEAQCDYARKTTERLTHIIKGTSGDKSLIVTGHSLGGRLAQEVAIEYDLKAYVFNSAELSRQSKASLFDDPIRNDRLKNITSVSSYSDPLTIWQSTKPGRAVVGQDVLKGQRIILMNEGKHSMTDLENAISQERLGILKVLHDRKHNNL